MSGFPRGLTLKDSSGAGISAGQLEAGTVSGPASYATGGFTIDLSARFSSLDACPVTIEDDPSDVLPGGTFLVVELDTPAAGQARVSVALATDSTPGAAQNPITGVAIVTEGNTPAVATDSTAPTVTAQAGSVLGSGSAQNQTHEHGHEHTVDELPDHDHAASGADSAKRELGAGTDLSSVTFRYLAVGSAA